MEPEDPVDSLPTAPELVDPDKVKITGEAIVRSWWQILLAAIFGSWWSNLMQNSESPNPEGDATSESEAESVDAKDVEITGGGCLYTFFSLILGGLGI